LDSLESRRLHKDATFAFKVIFLIDCLIDQLIDVDISVYFKMAQPQYSSWPQLISSVFIYLIHLFNTPRNIIAIAQSSLFQAHVDLVIRTGAAVSLSAPG
jgi:hypothetical protein